MAGPLDRVIPATPDLVQPGLPDAGTVPYPFPAGAAGFLFNRTWLLSIISPLSGALGYNSLRTVFEIEKTPFASANKAKIQIYNLNDLSRFDYLKGARIGLSVGYAQIPIPILFNAVVIRVTNERKGPDIVTTFECGEAEAEIESSTCNLVYPAGTPITTLVIQLIKVMQLYPGPIIGLVPKPYNTGGVLTGSCKDNLTKLLDSQNLSWSVQSGRIVQIAPRGVPTQPVPLRVDVTTGLIGVPNLSGGQGGDNIMTFTTLIRPGFIPGAAVSVISQFRLLLGVIRTAKIEGDTHGNKWQIKCECAPIGI